jgi:hypothetical protein
MRLAMLCRDHALEGDALVEQALGALPPETGSDVRFAAVLAVATRTSREGTAPNDEDEDVYRGRPRPLTTPDGRPIGRLAPGREELALHLGIKNEPEFHRWVEERAGDVARDLYARWRDESGSQA